MSNKKNNNSTPFCSFCGKFSDEVEQLVGQDGLYICNECVKLCYNLINDIPADAQPNRSKRRGSQEPFVLPKPKELFKYLNEYVIGIECGNREDGDSMIRQHPGKSGKNTGQGKVQRPADPEAAPAVLPGSRFYRNLILRTYQGNLMICPGGKTELCIMINIIV